MSSVESLIQVVNKLQDTFASLGQKCPIDLPQIAVVGEQSAGKSSVLENFVGKDFLPRGSGIVTRRPLVLQLINQPGPEYATFLHRGEEKYFDFEKVRDEIVADTNRIAGANTGISDIPINLRIFSPFVLNLTLVDLPGITKVRVGDQPANIEQIIGDMIFQYISQPNCLILAIIPANIDIANSAAIQLASQVDPERNRTIGVLTKIDLMDKGTDCREILENRVVALKRGFVGIVNRSQSDINTRKNIKEAQESEMQFFRDHPVYRNLIERIGTHYLQKSLNHQLSIHIKETLPTLRGKLQEQISKIEEELGPNLNKVEEDSRSRSRTLLTLVQSFAKKVDIVLGYQQEFVDTKQLSGGSKINRIFYSRLPYTLENNHPSPEVIRHNISIGVINSRGVGGSLFTPDVAFKSVTQTYILNTNSACIKVAESVGAEIINIVDKACDEQFEEYPTLKNVIRQYCNELVHQTVKEATKYIELYLACEHAHINTQNPDFLASADSAIQGPGSNKTSDFNKKILHKGYLQVGTSGLFKSTKNEYFILQGNMLSSYKDSKAADLKYQILLEGCHIKDHQSGYTSKLNSFQIYHKDKKDIGNNITSLDLSCKSEEEAHDWKAFFMEAGVVIDKHQTENIAKTQEDIMVESDPNLRKEVEYIYALVNKYLQILYKMEVDIVSKICVTCIIHEVRAQLLTDTVAAIINNNSMDDLLKEDESILAKRKEKQNIYRSCNDALKIIHEVMNKMGADSSSQKYPNLYTNMKGNFIDSRMDSYNVSGMYSQ